LSLEIVDLDGHNLGTVGCKWRFEFPVPAKVGFIRVRGMGISCWERLNTFLKHIF
jgi:hypothetical protein